MNNKAKAQRHKQTKRDSIKRMREQARYLERLSEGVPQEVLDDMQFEALLSSGPQLINLGAEPSEAQISALFEKSFEAQIKRLEAYWKGSDRNV